MRLTGKTAIVTGGGSGFGEGIAKTYAREGANVVVNDLNGASAERVASEIALAGGKAIAVAGDVTRSADWRTLRAAALEDFGSVQIVVNNAGTTHRNKPVLDVTEGEFDRVYAVNVKSIYWSVQEFVPYFRGQGGGVFVNMVMGETALLSEFMGVEDTPENRQRFLAGIPLGRFSTPQDIANACLYLASDEAEFVTGVCLEVDGGRCI